MSQLLNPARLAIFSGNPALVQRLIRIYLDTSPKVLGDIEVSVASGDIEQVGSHAHSLKGLAAELGAEELAEFSHRLQMAARAGDVAVIGSLVKDLVCCYKETTVALQLLNTN